MAFELQSVAIISYTQTYSSLQGSVRARLLMKGEKFSVVTLPFKLLTFLREREKSSRANAETAP